MFIYCFDAISSYMYMYNVHTLGIARARVIEPAQENDFVKTQIKIHSGKMYTNNQCFHHKWSMVSRHVIERE